MVEKLLEIEARFEEIERRFQDPAVATDPEELQRLGKARAELESLGIQLGVEKPGEGFFEAELYSLPPENFYLDAISFDDAELAAQADRARARREAIDA